MHEIRRIVVPVDFSPTSDYALSFAVSLAARLGAQIQLLHVYHFASRQLPAGGAVTRAEFLRDYASTYHEQLDGLIARHAGAGVAIQGVLLKGVPDEQIVKAARDLNADLIVIGSQGRSGLAEMILGTVAERVVRTSTVPVLTIRLP